ncbi:hypothetical protein GCM10020256_02170 [Streptomyces thermocoprophilus]
MNTAPRPTTTTRPPSPGPAEADTVVRNRRARPPYVHRHRRLLKGSFGAHGETASAGAVPVIVPVLRVFRFLWRKAPAIGGLRHNLDILH